MKLLIVSGSPRASSHARVLADFAREHAKEKYSDIGIEFLDLHETNVERFQGFGVQYNDETKDAIKLMKEADLIIISTPIYNTSFSSAVKNIFEHSHYKSLKGKVAGFIINAGGSKSFENSNMALTSMASYFSIYCNPRPVFVAPDAFDENMKLTSELVQERIKDLVDSSIDMTEKLGA